MAAISALMLAGCGGQDELSATASMPYAAGDSRRAALAVTSEAAVPRVASLLFEFGEEHYSQLFPSPSADRVAGSLAYRYYPETKTYLLVDVRTRQVYGLGGPFGPQLVELGNALDFLPPPVLTLLKSGTGTGTVSSQPAGIACGATCTYADFGWDRQVTLMADPARDSVLADWSGACSGGSRSCLLAMTEPRVVGVRFEVPKLVVTVSGNGNVIGLSVGIECGLRCSATIPATTSAILTAVPGAGSRFAGWSGACTGSGTTCLVPMNQAVRTVSAVFQSAGS